jgi:tripartite-type tricarboxylate transporter receptor subunit TctC
MKRLSTLGVLLALAMLLIGPGPASAQAPFYQDKTITIAIGGGGAIDVSARLVATYMRKYIPGNPNIIVQTMPGGAHLVATNHAFNVAQPDGLTLLALNPAVGIAQLTKVKAVRFDLRKFGWLGSTGPDGVVLAVRPDLPYKTFAEFMKSGKELVVGTTGPGSNAHDIPLLLAHYAGAKFKLVSGYPANSDILLALERKEVDIWTATASSVGRAVERGSARGFVRNRVPFPGFENLPVDEDLSTSAMGKTIMAVRSTPSAIGRAFAVTPGTPAERVKILQDAFAQAMKDPQMLADAAKAKIPFEYVSPAEIAKDISTLVDQPAEIQEEFAKVLLVKK